ncbi:Tip elongation aberrant protein Tea4 [Termitomyces sp. T112]|nr:Tip elongation aberrant protein Tea4 [Termitomyces sp. T112]
MQAVVDIRRPTRQDTFDLRGQIQQDDADHLHAHADAASATYTDDEETSVIEEDSEGEEHEDYIDDDGSSSLSIPNESIDFDLVYSLHSFAATVEGQANVVKGDSLFLMDDSNSYWWLVRVLKTQEVGYIPAENIETPFERLARLNKHRNVDLASPTQAELNENLQASQERLRTNLGSRAGSNNSPSPLPLGARGQGQGRNIRFGGPRFGVVRYPRAIWREDEIMETEGGDEEDDWLEFSEHEDAGLAEEQPDDLGEQDDLMDWEDEPIAEPPQPTTTMQAGGSRPEPVQKQQQPPPPVQQQQQLSQEPPQQMIQAPPLRSSGSRERLQQDAMRSIDPAEATETRKLTVTPTIARGDESRPYQSSDVQQQRIREEEEARKQAANGKGKMAPPVSSASPAKPNTAGKLRKERESDEESGNGKDKKKRGMFGNLFKSKKDKKDKNASAGSSESGDSLSRLSEDSLRSSGNRPSTSDSILSPTTATAMQQQQQQALANLRTSVVDPQRNDPQSQPPQTPERLPAVSQHASQLRQRDQQQQALYTQQYLNRSPSSPPEAQPSYGLQSASALSSYHSPSTAGSGLGPPTQRPRPGSLILTQNVMDVGGPVPELSVIRVFAGKNLQTEATFKTALLNSSTTSKELIKQATQRFRLSIGDEEGEYYLTVKQVEGGASAVLRPEEKPLIVFEHLVEEAMEMPKVKRSSVGSISSVASNLSMHPAIKKLPMNDFTDDSAVKFYLNRRGDGIHDGSALGHDEGDETLIADSSFEDSFQTSPRLAVSTVHNVTPERFTSPLVRFALQLIIYPDDLPEDMVFHPQTEAIVFKDTLREADVSSPVTVSPNMRRKVFVFPKNATVAEVIELGLERFGISEGVVDGGDEIEDKTTKRRSSTRVRYGLFVTTPGSPERELAPSSRVIEAFPRPPTLKAAERPTPSSKRRSVDSNLILGSLDDVNPDDPVFILRRAMTYRNSTSRHRMSAPLDELALHHLHRDSASSASLSDPSSPSYDHKPSRQEIIARQREASRANQRAILSAQTNSYRGMDVLLPGNTILRSSRYDVNDRMRYSYVDNDGETYDISDIIEEELRENNFAANRNDLLESVLGRKDVVGEKLNRVLSKIKNGKAKEKDLMSLSSVDDARRSRSISEYSVDTATSEIPRSVSPLRAADIKSKTPTDLSRTVSRSSPISAPSTTDKSRPGTTTPTGRPTGSDRRQPSIASVISDISGYATPVTHTEIINEDEMDSPRSASTPKPPSQLPQRRPIIPHDDFGVAHMLSIIEYKDAKPKTPLPPLDPVDALLFGRPLDLQALHPKIRDVYAPTFKQLEEMDKILDDYLGHVLTNA